MKKDDDLAVYGRQFQQRLLNFFKFLLFLILLYKIPRRRLGFVQVFISDLIFSQIID